MHDLVKLNYDFGKAELNAEKAGNRDDSVKFFDLYLHEKLLFRRAGGSIISKQQFLDDLGSAGNKTEKLLSTVIEVTESEDGRTAEVLVLVQLEGQRGGNDATGSFRNRRLFVKEPEGDWKCLVWFNTRITPIQAGQITANQ